MSVLYYPYDLVTGLLRDIDLELRGDLKRADGFTRIAWLAQAVVTGIAGYILIIVNFVVMIPRMLFCVIPGVNIAYILVNQIVYMALLGPTVMTSLLWEKTRASIIGLPIRTILLLIGIPFALLDYAHSSLAPMGGPDEHGANKNYKLSVFQWWPLSARYRRWVRGALEGLGFPNLLNG